MKGDTGWWPALPGTHLAAALVLVTAATYTTVSCQERAPPAASKQIQPGDGPAGEPPDTVEEANSEMHLAPVPRHPESVIPEGYFTAPHNVNPHPYRYVINNPNLCMEQSEVLLLIAVRTVAAHVDRRMAIRDTWATNFNMPAVNAPLVFLIGAARDRIEQVEMNLENRIYRDIVQEDFVDSAANQTLKAVMAFRWARAHCPHAAYVMIAQDDIVVDVFKLIPYLQGLQQKRAVQGKVVLCYLYPCCLRATPPDGSSPHQPAPAPYTGQAFPAYASPSVYVASLALVHRLYLMSLDTPLFSPEGPWIGVLAEKLGVAYSNTQTSYAGLDPEETPAGLVQNFNRSDYLSTQVMFGVTAGKFPRREAEMLRHLWSLILAHHRDKPKADANRHVSGQKQNGDTHIYQVALAALLIDMAVMAIIGYIIFCRKRPKVVPFHASTHYHYMHAR